jgi:hypothetical protein
MIIDENYKVCFSSKLTSEEYANYNGRTLNLPINSSHHPSKEALAQKAKEFRE